jgi:hypothetical protein
MSAPVDVVATINSAADRADFAAHVDELVKASDSVAELIEAVTESREALQAFANNGMPANWRRHEAAEMRLDAALAGCKGESA